MIRRLFSKFSILLILVSGLPQADVPKGSAYIDGEGHASALILLHGRGSHPRGFVVDSLRVRVNRSLGWHTLSMPLPNKNKKEANYASEFPANFENIKDGIRFLREERGVSKVFLMGYKLGARVVSAFVADNPNQPIAGIIVIECMNDGGYPLSCLGNLEKVNIPVLDMVRKKDKESFEASNMRKHLLSDIYIQIQVEDPSVWSTMLGRAHHLEIPEGKAVGKSWKWLKAQP